MHNPKLEAHNGSWNTPSKQMYLSPNEVHIWKVELTPPELQLPVLQNLLSPDEHERAQRIRFHQQQQAFITSRGILRFLISRYLQTGAQSLEFSQGPHGKPFLLRPCPNPSLFFNISHSHQLALYAFSLNREVGIDLEYKHRKIDYPPLVTRICSDQEKAVMSSLEPTEQKNTLLACWTRKEAYLKATGKGITVSLHSITVSLPPSSPISLLRVDGDEQETTRWTMHEIQANLDYTAALVAAGNDWQPTYWNWSWDLMQD